MSEYRSALRAARERIEHLEAIAPPEAKARAVSFARLFGLLAIAVPVVGVLAFASTVVRAQMLVAPTVIALPPPPPPAQPPLPPTDGLEWLPRSWYATSFSGPWVTEPAPDGSREIIGLAWDRAREVDGLFVVAFDRATLRVKWRAGSFPGFAAREGAERQHLVVVGERAVLADGHGELHTLDVRTGRETMSRTFASTPASMCTFGNGAGAPARAIVALDGGWRARSPSDNTGGSLFPWEINKSTLSLDPMTGRTSPAPQYKVCSSDHYCMYKEVNGCRDLEQREHAPQGLLRVSVHEVWNAGDDRVSLGGVGRGDDATPVAVGWTASKRAVTWETPLVTPDHPRRARGVPRAAIDGLQFYYLYPTADGPTRLVALDTKTGGRRFDIVLPDSEIGTRVHDVVAAGDDVLVEMNDELVVIDAHDGHVRGRLGSF